MSSPINLESNIILDFYQLNIELSQQPEQVYQKQEKVIEAYLDIDKPKLDTLRSSRTNIAAPIAEEQLAFVNVLTDAEKLEYTLTHPTKIREIILDELMKKYNLTFRTDRAALLELQSQLQNASIHENLLIKLKDKYTFLNLPGAILKKQELGDFNERSDYDKLIYLATSLEDEEHKKMLDQLFRVHRIASHNNLTETFEHINSLLPQSLQGDLQEKWAQATLREKIRAYDILKGNDISQAGWGVLVDDQAKTFFSNCARIAWNQPDSIYEFVEIYEFVKYEAGYPSAGKTEDPNFAQAIKTNLASYIEIINRNRDWVSKINCLNAFDVRKQGKSIGFRSNTALIYHVQKHYEDDVAQKCQEIYDEVKRKEITNLIESEQEKLGGSFEGKASCYVKIARYIILRGELEESVDQLGRSVFHFSLSLSILRGNRKRTISVFVRQDECNKNYIATMY